MHTMTKRQGKSGTIDVKALLVEDEEFLRALVRTALQEVLEAEMTEALGAEKGERAAGRQGYRSGYYGRTLITRVGKLELRVPQDRTGRFSTELATISSSVNSGATAAMSGITPGPTPLPATARKVICQRWLHPTVKPVAMVADAILDATP
jgi:hypothetical protein